MNIVRDLKISQSLRENRGLLALLFVAIALRFLYLTSKAPHFDEGVYGFFVQEIWRKGFFPYDPSNFHGPVYYYAIQLAEQFFGKGIFAFRAMSGICSVLTVYYVWKLNKFFGEVAIWAAVAVAVSPAAVFYSRYTMHEPMFILFQVLFAHHYFDYLKCQNAKSACMLGLYAALLFGTKETTVLFLFCFLASDFLAKTIETKKKILNSVLARQNLKYVALSLVVMTLVICFIFSGLGSQPERIVDFVKAYSFWTKTGTQHASGHEKPFFYWFELLARYEWPAILGVLVSPLLIIFGNRTLRFFSFFALANLIVYAAIPYKTPWCILGILWPLYFLTGFAMTEMKSFSFVKATAIKVNKVDPESHRRSQRLSGILVITLCLVSLVMSVRLNFFHFQDSSEPYVYVQTSEDVNAISEILSIRIRNSPEDLNMPILINLKATWPLPWTLSNFTHITYRELMSDKGEPVPSQFIKDQRKLVQTADVIIVDQSEDSKVESEISRKYFKAHFKLRDAYNTCSLYLNAEKFLMGELEFVQGRKIGDENSMMKFLLVEPRVQ